MGRISRQVMFMEMARVAARRSTCFRLNVGALVTYNNSPISVGWNGQRPGAQHCLGNACPGIVPGNCGTIHAEVNALNKAGELFLENRSPVDLYVTNSPCADCIRYITHRCRLDVKRIFFEVPYRDTSSLDTLRDRHDTGVTQVYEVTPAGYIVDYFTRKVLELP